MTQSISSLPRFEGSRPAKEKQTQSVGLPNSLKPVTQELDVYVQTGDKQSSLVQKLLTMLDTILNPADPNNPSVYDPFSFRLPVQFALTSIPSTRKSKSKKDQTHVFRISLMGLPSLVKAVYQEILNRLSAVGFRRINHKPGKNRAALLVPDCE